MRRVAPVALLLAGCGGSEPVEERWVTYRDTARAFSVSYPASWQRAQETLTPGLTDPHEILTLSTHRARRGGERCNHVPENAMRDLRPGGVVLTLQERRGSGGFGERPRPYRLDPPRPSPPGECAGRTDIHVSFGGFRDAGRGLHVLAAFGPGEMRREVAERVVGSLKLEPAWRSRGLDLRLQPPTGWQVRARGSHVTFASYRHPPPPGEQCALPRGVGHLPADGAFVFLFEYVGLNRRQRMRFPGHPRFSLPAGERRSYECFGSSWMFRWRDKGRAFQAHAYLGERATPARKEELLAALRSLVVTP